ncbi:hypothetical protein, partial [Paraburkholderia sp. J10-1]|uniref:hypothetical protein n=1 Tax=Paraburkholderia sp. J10-1 TaxID=2805430 RepID=UPI002AB6CFD7
ALQGGHRPRFDRKFARTVVDQCFHGASIDKWKYAGSPSALLSVRWRPASPSSAARFAYFDARRLP